MDGLFGDEKQDWPEGLEGMLEGRKVLLLTDTPGLQPLLEHAGASMWPIPHFSWPLPKPFLLKGQNEEPKDIQTEWYRKLRARTLDVLIKGSDTLRLSDKKDIREKPRRVVDLAILMLMQPYRLENDELDEHVLSLYLEYARRLLTEFRIREDSPLYTGLAVLALDLYDRPWQKYKATTLDPDDREKKIITPVEISALAYLDPKKLPETGRRFEEGEFPDVLYDEEKARELLESLSGAAKSSYNIAEHYARLEAKRNPIRFRDGPCIFGYKAEGLFSRIQCGEVLRRSSFPVENKDWPTGPCTCASRTTRGYCVNGPTAKYLNVERVKQQIPHGKK